MSEYSERLRKLTGLPPLRTEPCPLCLRKLTVKEVKKDNENKGRLFMTCDDCDVFEWLDMPKCPECGRREYEAVCKNGKNCGKKYRTCPGQCSFRWINKH